MTYVQKPYTGSLFKNDKQGNSNRPDFKGSAMIGDQKFWVSGWNKAGRDGETFLSLSFQPAEGGEGKAEQPQPQGGRQEEEIAF